MSGGDIRGKGFTIVELLIVIVVIAILAAITIVAYNGIQARATFVRQTAALDRVGKAIQLWSAENGQGLYDSGAGAGVGGDGIGYFQAKNVAGYTSISVEDLLRSSGHLTGTLDSGAFSYSQVLLAPCTASVTDTRWLVMARVTPAPSEPVADQITDTGCNSSYVTTYTGGSYNSNLIKVY